eukprot:6592624-Pyramimonas_sp.AAC.2
MFGRQRQSQSEYKLHAKYFDEKVVDNVTNISGDVVNNIDKLIDNTVAFYNGKLEFMNKVPMMNQGAIKMYTDQTKSDIQFLLSMGLLHIESDDLTAKKQVH